MSTTASTPTAPGGVLHSLSPMDAAMYAFGGLTILYVFPPPPASSSAYDVDRLQASFINVVNQDYSIFLGELRVVPETGAVAVWQSEQVMAEGAKAIPFAVDHACELTTAQAVADVPSSLHPEREGATQLMTVKCSLLPDGGLAVGVNLSHCLVDGEAVFTFMTTWGQHYRGVPASERNRINHERHLMNPRNVGATMEHPEFRVPSPSPSPSPESSADANAAASMPQPMAMPATTRHAFHLSPTQLTALKAKVMDALAADSTTKSSEYVSTIDVVTALFTMLITQARGHGQGIAMTTGVNARTRFSPPLPKNYCGNVIFNAFNAFTSDELEGTPTIDALLCIARRIRASVLRRDEAFLRDAIEFITCQDGMKWNEVQVGTNFFFGKDLMFTSWANMGMYDADFGATPWYVGPPELPVCDGMSIIMEAMNDGSGLDVLVLLETGAMARLRELWVACPLLQ